MTLRQFLARARQNYGATPTSWPLWLDESNETLAFHRLDRGDHFIAFSVDAELDEVLTPSVLRSLCRRFGLPAEDFGLDPEPDG